MRTCADARTATVVRLLVYGFMGRDLLTGVGAPIGGERMSPVTPRPHACEM